MAKLNLTKLKEQIKEYATANKTEEHLLTKTIQHFRKELVIIHNGKTHHDEISDFLVKTVHEVQEGE
ncbi:hypothetical protein QRD86_00460 (plasmid) [Bacillus halotolerans]|uniref:hypothetical protein n=1 Tax=Bacillus halotolerans TaxID=260554 RepID=UPI0025705093|nr:hypothetical protein [Bacillus halotolerans]WJE41157.1 hypothetical protein QRD86_00460 [Bacillus halotolerans]